MYLAAKSLQVTSQLLRTEATLLQQDVLDGMASGRKSMPAVLDLPCMLFSIETVAVKKLFHVVAAQLRFSNEVRLAAVLPGLCWGDMMRLLMTADH